MKSSSFVDALDFTIPMTIFAPTNDAFVTFFKNLDINSQELERNKYLLETILRYHVVLGSALKVEELIDMQALKPDIENKTLVVKSLEGFVTIVGEASEADIVRADIVIGYVVVHFIDNVLLLK
eukprot:TRINITY_DN471_c1_g1_i1.p3 TRINITY_DN471_c1_g1~~TRINITY_DN471_c1_g1_i1.p3  ORF type:complete len:124 (+),score=21.43 TRINITY_DN471_c1_g1_i1:316-687(+)